MIGRVNQQQKHGAPPTDLLVCFPSRAHFTLIPKKLTSSARLMDRRQNQLKRLPSTRLADPRDKAIKATTDSNDVSEPTSPKVTCAGQIKVRPGRSANCKSWQSVMEEIERIHKKSENEKKKKKASWGDALGIKKDVMQFLTCLRNIKLDFRCFGAVPECELSSDEDDDEDEEADSKKTNTNHSESEKCKEEDTVTSGKDSRSMFSEWFMVVQDVVDAEKYAPEIDRSAAPPPPNALLLMRCRSAPAKSWLETNAKLTMEEEEEEEDDDEHDHKEAHTHQQQQQQEEENEEAEAEDHEGEKGRKKLREYLLVMEQYDTDFYKLSNDIAKETWVVGSVNPFSRSRSWKR